MIKIENVSKRYGDHIVFDNLDLEIPSGSVVRIKGDNGTGKSVLLNLLVGYSVANQGHITIDGKVLKKEVEFMPKAGVFINAPEFIPYLSGMENLKHLASFRKTADFNYIENLAKRLNFSDEINKKYKTYSLGMKQKLRIMQAIMEDNDYYLLDEPLDALDKKSRVATCEILSELANKNKTLIYVSHLDDLDDLNSMMITLNNDDEITIEEIIK